MMNPVCKVAHKVYRGSIGFIGFIGAIRRIRTMLELIAKVFETTG
jgi:hypothetical protein